MHNLFWLALLIRFVAPPIIFSLYHPLFAMLADEFILDGIFSPHHWTNTNTDLIPPSILGKT